MPSKKTDEAKRPESVGVDVFRTLQEALATISRFQPTDISRYIADKVRDDVGGEAGAGKGQNHLGIDPRKECSDSGSEISSSCSTYESSVADASYAAIKSQLESDAAFSTAQSDWEAALDEYMHAAKASKIHLQHAIKVSRNAFKEKYNSDSKALNEHLFATMKTDIAAALQANETAMGDASATLASAAATMLAAYTTFIGVTTESQCVLQTANATAEQEFWQGVETVRDS